MTDPQQQFPTPPPPVAHPYGAAAPAGPPAYDAAPATAAGAFPGAAPSQPQPGATPTHPGYGDHAYGNPAAPGSPTPARGAKGNAVATTAVILALVGFALELLRYLGMSVAYTVFDDAPLPQVASATIDVFLLLLYAGAVVLALIGLRRTGRLRAGIALGLGVSGATYLILQLSLNFLG